MDRSLIIQDSNYREYLPKLYRKHYDLWKARMLKSVDKIAESLASKSPEEVMEEYSLSPRDIALLVRLNYFTPEETEKYNLRRIEEKVPT